MAKATCAKCGYPISGLPITTTNCPECGTPFAVRPGTKKPLHPATVATHIFSEHASSGRAISRGWLLTFIGWSMSWLSLLVKYTLFDHPASIVAIAGGGLATLGALIAAIGTSNLLVWRAPVTVQNEHNIAARQLAIIGPWLWVLAGISLGVGSVLEFQETIEPPQTFLFLIPLFLAALAMPAHNWVMVTVAQLLDDGLATARMRSTAIGFPVAIGCFILGVCVIAGVNWGAFLLIVYLFGMCITILPGIYVVKFILAIRSVGSGIGWAERNVNSRAARDARQLAKWQKQAEIDRERERTHGSSAGL